MVPPRGELVLIAPLNWGLGHATRCIPIIYDLLEQKNRVIIAADGLPLMLLQKEFSQQKTVEFLEFPSFKIHYSATSSQVWAMLGSIPKIVQGIVHEHRKLQQIIREKNINFVISDNRFGLWTQQVPCAYITHQLMIKMPRSLRFLEPVAWALHRLVITRYTECWIPDFAGSPNLSGDLSHKYPLPQNARFIGNLSRFSCMEDIVPTETFHTVVVVSGIEPQRSMFEKLLIEKYASQPEKTLIIQGLPQQETVRRKIGSVTLLSHLSASELKAQLCAAKKIVCRSGYSTIMDLHALGITHKATFIPTPGQTEQEYLAKLHEKEFLQKQKKH
ncbi:MAG: hypothetical protein LBR81_05045 [Prevotellaceae bacterium]|nr:hypothetical protein [Prevotellaceae bacterium]